MDTYIIFSPEIKSVFFIIPQSVQNSTYKIIKFDKKISRKWLKQGICIKIEKKEVSKTRIGEIIEKRISV